MTNILAPLILDLLEWLDRGDHSYEEVMEAWRTSCPRLPVWEDANDRGLVARLSINGQTIIKPTESGRSLLRSNREDNGDSAINRKRGALQ
jgi:hypothetical protein